MRCLKASFPFCIALFLSFALGKQSFRFCEEAQSWSLNGRALVRDYQGRVLLLLFLSPAQCNEQCEHELGHLEGLHEQFPDVRVLAIAPQNESASDVRNFAWRFPRIRFEHETALSPVWRWFHAQHMDQFLFDRCSRFTNKLKPTTKGGFVATLFAVELTSSTQSCDPCEFDRDKRVKWHSFHPPVPPMPTTETGRELVTKSGSTTEPINGQEEEITTMVVHNMGELLMGTEGEESRRLQWRRWNSVLSSSTGSHQRRETTATTAMQQWTNGNNVRNEEEWRRRQQHQQGPAQLYQQQQPNEAGQIEGERQKVMRERERIERERLQQYWDEQRQRQQQHQQLLLQQLQQQTTRAPPVINAAPQQRMLQAVEQEFPRQNQNNVINKRISDAGTPSPVFAAVRYGKDPYSDRYQFGREREYPQVGDRIRPQQQQAITHQLRQQEQQQKQLRQMPSHQQTSAVLLQGQQQSASTRPSEPPDPAPLYPEGAEDVDYYGEDYAAEWTTETPSAQVQIPKPTKPIAPTVPTTPANKNFGFDLPCTGFTDESCYQQQQQLKPNEMHRCCRGRILFTDQCVPGKCSNMSTQLCCIQRFLQAKFSCCSDEGQGETDVGDHFSRCCFGRFVESDDSCCPRAYASEQWRSVHELCLPNVDLDLSAVKVPAPLMGTSLITEYDFGKTDKWRFDCRYGGHVQQYSYFEESIEEPVDGEKGGDEEE